MTTSAACTAAISSLALLMMMMMMIVVAATTMMEVVVVVNKEVGESQTWLSPRARTQPLVWGCAEVGGPRALGLRAI